MLIRIVLFVLLICPLVYSSKPTSTPYICIESSNKTTATTLPSCLPGYVLDIDNVIYESTHDDSCSGITRCQIENKNSLAFACNRKRTCQLDLTNLHFYINSTCTTTRRFFIRYRCLPIIQEQKDYLCDAPTQRRPSLGDINLSCLRNYRLFILNAWIGLSLRSSDDYSSKIKCNKDTLTTCQYDLSTNYRHLCEYQSKQECRIGYNQRPMLDQCPYGTQSNFSLVEYLCIPDEGIVENLPRVDICSSNERLTLDRGLLYSSIDSERIFCEKELILPRESRLRLFLLEKSPDFQIEYLQQIQTLELNPYFDVNFTNQKKDNRIRFIWKSNEMKSKFLLYFQIDSKISEYAPSIFEFNHKSNAILGWKQILGIISACAILLLILIVVIIYRIIRQRSKHDAHSIKDNDDQRPLDQPYLTTSSPTLLGPSQQRPYSTTSSIIMQQMHDDTSDRETLIKSNPSANRPTGAGGDIDNFYEEIKEQQQQTAFALRMNSNPNLYLEPNDFQDTKPFFQGQQTAQPIRDHHEVFYYECEK